MDLANMHMDTIIKSIKARLQSRIDLQNQLSCHSLSCCQQPCNLCSYKAVESRVEGEHQHYFWLFITKLVFSLFDSYGVQCPYRPASQYVGEGGGQHQLHKVPDVLAAIDKLSVNAWKCEIKYQNLVSLYFRGVAPRNTLACITSSPYQ